MRFDAVFLLGAGSGGNGDGKFYVAITDEKAPLTAHGPNGPRSSGQVRSLPGRKDVEKKVREKRREYRDVGPEEISSAALRNIVEQIQSICPEVAGIEAVFERDYIEFKGVSATPNNPQKPRRSKKPVHVWI